MKKIIFAFTGLLFIQFGFSQDTVNHFYIENGTIIWKCTFKSDLNEKQLRQRIENNNLLENLERDSIKIEGKIKVVDIDYKGAGYSGWTTPVDYMSNGITGYASISLTKEEYTVVVKKIQLVLKQNGGRWKYKKKGSLTDLEQYYITRKGYFPKYFKLSPSIVLNYTFTKLFQFQN